MEKNDFLLYNEIIYRIHACRTLEEFRPTLLAQVKLIIPYTYASLIAIQTDPETGELIHRDPYCKPQNFREVENAWLGRIDKAYTAWLSHAPESMVVRDSEILSGDKRFSAASYRELYTAYHVHDCMQMNITYAGQAMGRLALYRTRGDGLFTDQEAFYLRALAAFGVTPERMETGWIVRPQAYRTPGRAIVEGDWSNAAPWLCMGAIDGDSVTVKGLAPDSQQGDRAVCRVLGEMGVPIHHTADRYTSHPGRLHPTTIDARDIPDLVPVLAALAASIPGTTIITGAARLRLKESDRLVTTAATLNALGGQVAVTDDGLIIQGKAHLLGGTVDAAGDHRIAMAAAVAACACSEPVVITGAQAVEKSYPTFWHDLRALGKPVEEAP